MNQARARFERYINRRFGRTSTLKHYISDLRIFIDAVGNKVPGAVKAEDVVQNSCVPPGGHCGGRLAGRGRQGTGDNGESDRGPA